jgi:hypothetical protein
LRIIHLCEKPAADYIEQLSDILEQKSLYLIFFPLGTDSTHLMCSAFANQKQGNILDIRAVQPPYHFQALLDIHPIRSGHIVAAKCKQQPTKHRKVFLLQKRNILVCIVHQDIDNPAGADADANSRSSKLTCAARKGRGEKPTDSCQ